MSNMLFLSLLVNLNDYSIINVKSSHIYWKYCTTTNTRALSLKLKLKHTLFLIVFSDNFIIFAYSRYLLINCIECTNLFLNKILRKIKLFFGNNLLSKIGEFV